MAIYIVSGYAGHGKTAYVVKEMRSILKRGERVYSDIKLNPDQMKKWKFKKKFPFLERVCFLPDSCEGDVNSIADMENSDKRIIYWKHFIEIGKMQNGTVLADEGGVKFNARNFDRLPEDTQNKIMQHRHDKLDLYLTSPHWSRIDILIRQMAERIVVCKIMLGSTKFKKTLIPRISSLKDYHLEDMVRAENLGQDSTHMVDPIVSEWFWISERIMKLYDTGEIVGSSDSPPLIHRIRTCPTCNIMKTYHN